MGIGQDKLRPYKVPFIRGPQGSNAPHPSPSNHGSGCFPLIIYLVTRRCFLPYFVTFERRSHLEKVTAERTRSEQPPPPPLLELTHNSLRENEEREGKKKLQHSLTADSWDPVGLYCLPGPRSSNRRVSQHVRPGLTAGVYVAPRHLRAFCLPSRVQCEETC